MILSTMSNAEMQKELNSDYLELVTKIQNDRKYQRFFIKNKRKDVSI